MSIIIDPVTHRYHPQGVEVARVISTQYGYSGFQELQAFARKLKLKTGVEQQHHPVEAFCQMPMTRLETALSLGATRVTTSAFRDAMDVKRDAYRATQERLRNTPQPQAVVT